MKAKKRLLLKELMAETGVTAEELSAILWPDSNKRVRYEMIRNWMTKPVGSIRLDQLQALCEIFGTTNIDKIIEK